MILTDDININNEIIYNEIINIIKCLLPSHCHPNIPTIWIDGLLWHGSHDILWVLLPGLEGHSHFQSQKTDGQLRNNTGLEKQNQGFPEFRMEIYKKKNDDSKNTKHDVLPNFREPCSKGPAPNFGNSQSSSWLHR